MIDPFAALPSRDRRLVRNMAADAGCDPDAMFCQIVRAYLQLVQDADNVLPNDPTKRAAQKALDMDAIRRAGL